MKRRRLEAWFRPLGLSLRLRTDSPALLAAAEDAFRGFGPAEPTPSPDLDFLFFATGHDREAPAAYRDRGDRVRMRDGGSVLVVDRARGRARGRFAPALLADRARLRLECLELALQLMLPSRGFLGVHGAAVVWNGRAALLRGAGGAGKTTLAYAAARDRRFQILAEDAVWIDVERKTWWGLPRWFHPRPDAGRLFPELAGLAPALVRNGAPKLAVEMEALHPGSTTPQAHPGPVLLLDRRPGGPSRLTRLSLDAALPLWREGRAGTEEDFPDYERRVEELLRGNAWRLTVGEDLEEALAWIAGLLES